MTERLISVREAIDLMLTYFNPVPTESVNIEEGIGRIIAKDLIADTDLPRYSDSSMDGFAVRSSDISNASNEAPIELKVVADIPAGKYFDGFINHGEAARIMTGGVLPNGVDAVVPVEFSDFNYRMVGVPSPAKVRLSKAVQKGENIRLKGQDIHKGQVVILSGNILRPQEIGILATFGHQSIDVYRKPRIGIVSTGDELISPGDQLQFGKIYDSNNYTLAALVRQIGAEAIQLGTAPDQQIDIEIILDKALEIEVDLILSSAGVSVGSFDYVRSVVEKHGHITFWRVNMRPGKPIAFGDYRGVPIIGLPGNPVSAFVGFIVFVTPIIERLRGTKNESRHTQKVIIDEPIISDGRESYLRAMVFEKRGKLYARLTGHQGSGNLYSLVQANALLIVPSEVKSLPIGSKVDALIFC